MKCRFSVGITLLVVIACCLVPQSHADSLLSTVGVGTNGSGQNLCVNSSSSGAPVNCSGSWSFAQALSGTGSSQSFAEYGILGASATATIFASEPGSDNTQSIGQASWSDSLSFSNLNQSAMLETTISLAGMQSATSSCMGNGQPETCLQAIVQYYTEFNNGCQIIDCIVTAAGSCTSFVPIDGLSTVSFTGNLSVEAAASVINEAGGGGVSANYYDTGMVNSLSIVDANGNVIQGANIISASGTNYNDLAPPATVPEPSSLTMLGVLLFASTGLTLKKYLKKPWGGAALSALR